MAELTYEVSDCVLIIPGVRDFEYPNDCPLTEHLG